MNNIYKLDNTVKNYAWGSVSHIPELLGITKKNETTNEPWAELWMGAHPASPSKVNGPQGVTGLNELISSDPVRYLGEKTAKKYGTLPYLFKLLAAEKPLSIQAHPNLTQAKEGYERENRAGIALDAFNRNYKDSNHKPEIICALTPFIGMCGFRRPDEICCLIKIFLDLLSQRRGDAEIAEEEKIYKIVKSSLFQLVKILEIHEPENVILKNFLKELFSLPKDVCDAMTKIIISEHDISPPCGYENEWKLMSEFALQYPGDPAVIAPLYLNVFNLEPGEAIFLKAGILHAYCKGFGVELMANSDNVLRGGLTPKYIDIPELMNVLDFNPFMPEIIKPAKNVPCFTYTTPCEEFSLTVIKTENFAIPFSVDYPSIGIITEGELKAGEMVLKKGESIFIPPGENLLLQGTFTTFYIAACL